MLSPARMGGQISGGHGIWQVKIAYLRQSLDGDIMGLMQGIKQAFDPQNILTPGKICAP